jgi:hypothetical protein
MVCTALQALGGRAPAWFSHWRRQRSLPGFPDGSVRLNTHSILQSELGEFSTELRALSISCIRQYYSHGNPLLHRKRQSNGIYAQASFGAEVESWRVLKDASILQVEDLSG